jgi:predicted restriction endonuclease
LEKKYGCCIVSGDGVLTCEACHIVPYSESDVSNKYDIKNGILLTASLHILFDKHLMSINENGYVVLSKKILSDKSYKNFNQFNNKKVTLDKQTMNNMKNHYDKFVSLDV